MHPRNPYREPPNFDALARYYPALKTHLKRTSSGASTIDFKDSAAQRYQTGMPIYKPLVPGINWAALRLNYVLWIQDIVRASSHDEDPSSHIRGIDIGTGASAIYPLLICALEPTCEMVATDIDPLSLSYARANVHFNDLDDRIKVVQVGNGDVIFPPLKRYDFAMCNPPFYSSVEEIQLSLDRKELEPSAVCTRAENEMITAGGEVTFVCKMVDDSLSDPSRCKFYTSMLGKMSSVAAIVGHLKSNKITNYGITEFVQGQTRRWAIVWGWFWRLPDHLIRLDHPNPTLKGLMPPRTTLHLSHPIHSVKSLIQPLFMVKLRAETENGFVAFFFCDTWSRTGRRKNLKEGIVGEPLEVMVTAEEGGVKMQWTKGYDAELFQSLVSHLARKCADVGSS